MTEQDAWSIFQTARTLLENAQAHVRNEMKKTIIFLALLVCGTAFAAETNPVVKVGDSIALHWKDDSPLRNYGDGSSLMGWKTIIGNQCMMWKVGNGILVLEHTTGIGRISKLTYVIRDAKGKTVAAFPVNEFNPKTREMTITVPNQNLERTRNTAPLK